MRRGARQARAAGGRARASGCAARPGPPAARRPARARSAPAGAPARRRAPAARPPTRCPATRAPRPGPGPRPRAPESSLVLCWSAKSLRARGRCRLQSAPAGRYTRHSRAPHVTQPSAASRTPFSGVPRSRRALQAAAHRPASPGAAGHLVDVECGVAGPVVRQRLPDVQHDVAPLAACGPPGAAAPVLERNMMARAHGASHGSASGRVHRSLPASRGGAFPAMARRPAHRRFAQSCLAWSESASSAHHAAHGITYPTSYLTMRHTLPYPILMRRGAARAHRPGQPRTATTAAAPAARPRPGRPSPARACARTAPRAAGRPPPPRPPPVAAAGARPAGAPTAPSRAPAAARARPAATRAAARPGAARPAGAPGAPGRATGARPRVGLRQRASAVLPGVPGRPSQPGAPNAAAICH